MLTQDKLAPKTVSKSFVSMHEISFVVAEAFPVSKIMQDSFPLVSRRKRKENMTDARIFKQQKSVCGSRSLLISGLLLADDA